jgi:hypothetical protein
MRLHLRGPEITTFVAGDPVPRWAARHLMVNCGSCHERLFGAMDMVLRGIVSGHDQRDVDAWLTKLDRRFKRRRRFCPEWLSDGFQEKDPAVMRHLRFCTLCRFEMEEEARAVMEVSPSSPEIELPPIWPRKKNV